MRGKLSFIITVLFAAACAGGSSGARPDESRAGQPDRRGTAEGEVASEPAPEGETFEIDEEAVAFDSHGATFAGTILRPRDEETPTDGVVIVHDHGPVGRDGTMSEAFATSLPVEVSIYRTIAEELAAVGFAVLLYDKRTCVEGAATWCTYPREHLRPPVPLGDALVDDARAAAAALSEGSGVERVHFVGHGQGAMVSVAAADDGSKVVLLAPSSRPLDEVTEWQTAETIRLIEARIAKVGDVAEADLLAGQLADVKRARDAQKEGFAALRDGTASGELLGVDVDTWQSHRALHERAMARLRDGNLDVLAIVGGADRDFPPENAAEVIALVGERIVVVEDLTHLMVLAGDDDDATVVAPVVLQRLVTFFE